MSIIAKCDYCVLEGATYRRQTEIYDGILPDVMMCSNCGYAALFERERIIKIAKNRICFDYLEKPEYCDDPACYALADLIDKIKGEQK